MISKAFPRALSILSFKTLLFSGFIVGSMDAALAASVCRITQTVPTSALLNVPLPTLPEKGLTGQAMALAWDFTNLPVDFDGYLVVGTPDDIRFEGDGFVALPANARAPRSLQSFSKRTRLIVPLSSNLSNRKGSAGLILFESGTKDVNWEIVQTARISGENCREQSVASGLLRTEIAFGAPQLLAQDRFSNGQPRRAAKSNNGRYVLFDFSDRYEVLDANSGDLLIDRAGTGSTLSPSGRYVTSFDGAGRLEITDIVAKETIFKMDSVERMMYGGPELVGWLNGDSLLLISYNRQGGTNVVLPLINGRKISSGSISCNSNCSGLHMSSLGLDLDQLAYAIADSTDLADAPHLHSLVEVADSPVAIKEWDEAKPDERFGAAPKRPRFRPEFVASPFLQAETIVTRRELGGATHWQFSDQIKFTYWSGSESSNNQIRRRSYVAPSAEGAPTAQGSGRGKIARRSITDGGALMTPKSFREKLDDGLWEFGVKLSTSESGRVELVATGTDPDGGPRAAAMLNQIVTAASQHKNPVYFRKQAPQQRKSQSYLLQSYRSTSGCIPVDDIPRNERKWEENKGVAEPPFISVDRLAGFVRFQLSTGTLFIIQQYETCGSGPLMYGNVVGVIVPNDRSADIIFKRLGSISAESGRVSLADDALLEERVGFALQLSDAPALMVKVVAGKYVVLVSKNSGAATVLQASDLSFVQMFRDLPSSLDLNDITMTEDLRNLVQINNTGSLSFYDLKSASRILNGQFVDDELALFDEHLNFESTSEGASYVYVRVPGSPEVYSLDQFADRFFKARIASDVLSGMQFPSQSVADLRPPTIDVEQRTDGFVLEARSEVGLDKVIVSADGMRSVAMDVSGKFNVQTSVPSQNQPSSRWVTFWATDKVGIFSNYRTFFRGNGTYRGKLRLISLGIDKFNGAAFSGKAVEDLTYAATDADRFEKAIASFVAPSYASFESSRPTSPELLKSIASIANETRQPDTLIVFLSSHGLKEQGEFSLVLPAKQPGAKPELVSFDLISRALASAKGRVFVFLDACHSAETTETQDNASERLISTSQSIVVISASKGKQISLEGSQWKGGVFTTAVIDFLSERSRAAVSDPKHYPTVAEMYAAIRKDVAARTHGLQTPWLRRASWQGPQSIN
jgi:hypothetical protein